MKKIPFFLLLIAFVSACKKDTVVTAQAPIVVKTMEVGAVSQQNISTYVGVVRADTEVPLSFNLGGKVLAIRCRNGERVRKGQVLLLVDSTQTYQAYLTAKASLNQAEDAYRRLKKLYNKGTLAEVKWVEINTKLQQARAMEAAARTELNNCRLTAPIDGVVADLDLQVGQMIAPGITALKVLQTDALHVLFSVPEQEIKWLRNGQPARVILTSVADTIPAKVIYTALVSDPLTHACEVHVAFSENADVLPGMAAKVELALNADGQELIVLPAHAVSIDKNGHYVWSIQSNTVHKRRVSVGSYVANGVVITDGLSVGDKVVVEGMNKLYEGAQI